MPHNMNLFFKSFYKNYIKNIKKFVSDIENF